MRIAHISDIHHTLGSLEDVLSTKEVKTSDLIVVTGDFAGRLGKKEKDIIDDAYDEIRKIQDKWDDEFRSINKRRTTRYGFQDFVTAKLEDTSDPKTSRYNKARSQAKQLAMDHYQDVKDLLETATPPKRTVFGNWESEEYFDVFGDWDMHNKSEIIGGLKFFGYGGGEPKMSPFLTRLYSSEDEMHDSLLKEKPDVILSHVPPKKITDQGNTSGANLGWAMLRSYLFESYVLGKPPVAVLAGHSHTKGAEYLPTGTLVFNPGNLGKADEEKSGTFGIIEIEEGKVKSANHYVCVNE